MRQTIKTISAFITALAILPSWGFTAWCLCEIHDWWQITSTGYKALDWAIMPLLFFVLPFVMAMLLPMILFYLLESMDNRTRERSTKCR
jgi:hypothetical protein